MHFFNIERSLIQNLAGQPECWVVCLRATNEALDPILTFDKFVVDRSPLCKEIICPPSRAKNAHTGYKNNENNIATC